MAVRARRVARWSVGALATERAGRVATNSEGCRATDLGGVRLAPGTEACGPGFPGFLDAALGLLTKLAGEAALEVVRKDSFAERLAGWIALVGDDPEGRDRDQRRRSNTEACQLTRYEMSSHGRSSGKERRLVEDLAGMFAEHAAFVYVRSIPDARHDIFAS